jgi:hypothetical protein
MIEMTFSECRAIFPPNQYYMTGNSLFYYPGLYLLNPSIEFDNSNSIYSPKLFKLVHKLLQE